MSDVAALTRLRQELIPPFAPGSFKAGMKVASTPSIAIAAWGLVTGVAMVESGLKVPLALVMTLTVYAGSAQLAVLPLLATGAPLAMVWVTAALVNLRFVIFSAASRAYFSKLSRRQRLVSSYLNGDVGFALFMQRYGGAAERGNPEQWGFFIGSGTLQWASWQVSSVAGILLGGLAPTTWGLGLAAVLALVAVLIPMASRAPALLGVVVTGVLAVLTVRLPFRLGLLCSVVVGVTVALLAESALPQTRRPHAKAPQMAASDGDHAS
jgi:predicted branched-subunit amino acid permease